MVQTILLRVNLGFEEVKIIKNRHTDNSKFDQLLKIDDYFGLIDRIKWQDLAEARMQYGHHTSMRNPWFTPFLFAQRMRYDIINLDRVLIESL